MESTIVKSIDYNAYFGDNHVVKNVNIEIPEESCDCGDGAFRLRKNDFSAWYQPDA